jgi:hypothetical protein
MKSSVRVAVQLWSLSMWSQRRKRNKPAWSWYEKGDRSRFLARRIPEAEDYDSTRCKRTTNVPALGPSRSLTRRSKSPPTTNRSVLFAFAAGPCCHPRIEEPALLFIDMRSPTAITERTGEPGFAYSPVFDGSATE